ncbi:MAG: DUF971 domain-containing protein [Acidimicrobiia bacterium]|nr:DUF971 domain-containing protein [Acidimicrobiia bacterium]NNF69577.1 DUF971 domain-containing protein [Acidimicrobiia bacterium]
MDVPVRISVEGGSRVVIEWESGPASTISARDLRAACVCAACREPSGEEATQRVLEGDVGITEAALVGGYAITFTFSPDGHGTGIYPYDVLRSMSAS